ncbi:MAG: HEAT repeat domain-containing protein [Candidatus Latescibacterota bacterium]
MRADEVSRLVPLALAYGLVMASLYVLKPARNGLFLDRLGVGQLPYVLLLVALVGGLVALAFTRLAGRLRLGRLVPATFLFLMANLVGFRLLLEAGPAWGFYLFYVWVSLYGLMATSLLWLLASVVFNPRQARRLFGLIGSAGIAGAVAGGLLTGQIATRVGTHDLLLVCALLLAASLLLVWRLRCGEGPGALADAGPGQGPLAAIAGSQLLRLLAGMAAVVAVVAAIIDVQFNDIVDRAFPDRDAKTAFFGEFFAYLSAFAFLFQVWGTPRVLRSLGVVSALLFLPLSMAAGSAAVLVAPGLASGVLLKIGDGGFRHSLHKAAVEILYLPVPAVVRARTKVLLDITVDNLGTGVGALLVLVLTGVGVSYPSLGWVSLALVGLWVVLVAQGRGAYVGAFRRALERREIDPGRLTVDVREAAALQSLIAALGSASERQVVYALEMLSPIRSRRLLEPLRALLRHPSAGVRRRAVALLSLQEPGAEARDFEPLLRDGDLGVRVTALHHLYCTSSNPRERLEQALQDPDPRVRSAAVGCLAEHGAELHGLIDTPFVERLLTDPGPAGEADRQQAAAIVASLYRPEWEPHLERLLHDPSPRVVEAAIGGLGRTRPPAQLESLIERLGDPRLRRPARQTLATYGPAALGRLRARLCDPATPAVVRRGITRVLGDIPEQEAVDILLRCLAALPPDLEYLATKSLSRLRASPAGLHFDEGSVGAAVEREVEAYALLLQLHRAYGGEPRSPGVDLLAQALAERQGQHLERIFRLLGLRYPPADMHHAYLGLVSGRPLLRASALEFLDNLLAREVKERLVPLLDADSPEALRRHSEALVGRRISTRTQALHYLLAGRDPWLRACAAYSARDSASQTERRMVRGALLDPDPRVQEAARLALATPPA